jgi:WD domain, G-beta repeat
LAISPDGRFLAWPVDDYSVQFKTPQEPGSTFYGTRIRLYDMAADKTVDRFPSVKGSIKDLAFTNDGKNLISVDSYGSTVRVWDFAAGREERSFHLVTDALKKKSFVVGKVQLSPDGKTVVATYVEHSNIERLGLRGPPTIVRLWEVATGKELPELNGGHPVDGAFSPDGRLVVTHPENHVCEIATGKRVVTLPGKNIGAAAFSPDGRFLATIVRDLIQVWEVATWTKQFEFKGHRDPPTTLAFSPLGQLLSGSVDTTVLAWDLRPPRPATRISLDTAWTELLKYESAEAFKAEGVFLAAAPEAVKFFADRIKPEEPLDPKRAQRLIAELDNDQFAERDAASKALSALGLQIKPYLEEAVKTAKSTEVQDRAKKILEGLQAAAATPQQLRELRAVLVLEMIGDDNSRRLLNKWASGPAGARLTCEATAALKRMVAK